MLYLVTGSNGTGKTLNTLKWVRDLQLQNPQRAVFYNGRFKLKPEKEAEFGWHKFDFSDWQTKPDGSIFIIDEAHNDLPVRPSGQKPPDPIAMLAEHRSRGFDFFLITQHPNNIDAFVRRLIGSPGWHRHLKRPFGYDWVTCLEFDAVNTSAEKSGASKSANVSRIPFPKEVYEWYDSAVLHTGKKTIPKQFFVLGACVLLVPFFIWLSFDHFSQSADSKTAAFQQNNQNHAAATPAAPDWVNQYQPRIRSLPHTAPRYDEITKPVRAPIPAACIATQSRGCSCYSQQGTYLPQVTPEMCIQIVNYGYFLDFDSELSKEYRQQNRIHRVPDF